jgi:hypothetical protein
VVSFIIFVKITLFGRVPRGKPMQQQQLQWRRRQSTYFLDYESSDTNWVASASAGTPGMPGTLKLQCTHRHRRGKRRGKRCRQQTNYDYRVCDDHLMRVKHLKVKKSRLENGAGLGLFAASASASAAAGSSIVVFRRGEIIGEFAGELIDNAEYERRYGSQNGFARYVVGQGANLSHDESFARTALSYANDGVNLKDPLMRRNYVFKSGTHVVWHDTEWPHVINCVCDLNQDKDRACLVALCDIRNDEELLWSYSGSHLPSKDERGEWVKSTAATAAADEPVDSYWFGWFGLAESETGCADVSVKTRDVKFS